MPVSLLPLLLFASVLGAAAALQAADVPPAPPDDEPDRLVCTALGASCLLGSVGPAVVVCPPGVSCLCRHGNCVLGFPQAPRCDCGPDPGV